MSTITIIPDFFVMRLTQIIREERRGRLYEVEAVGVFASAAAEHEISTAILQGTPTSLRIDYDDGRTVIGKFVIFHLDNRRITMVSIGATHNG
jgi:hypothetical protein